MNLTIQPYRLEAIWAFDHPHNQTVGEELTNGTELAIDHYYRLVTGRDPQKGSTLQFTLDTKPFSDAITTLVLQETDQFGSTYTDTLTEMPVWLCPWLQGFFGAVPSTIYVSVKALDSVV